MEVTANFEALPQQTITVTKLGAGAGLVSSSPVGIDCGPTCTSGFDAGTEVTLTAEESPGSTFSGWSGACSGATAVCHLTLDKALEVSATFTPILPPASADPSTKPRRLAITVGGTGSGTIVSNPAGIECGTPCSAVYPPGTVISLSATADSESHFSGWSGCDSVVGNHCTVRLGTSKVLSVGFEEGPTVKLGILPSQGRRWNPSRHGRRPRLPEGLGPEPGALDDEGQKGRLRQPSGGAEQGRLKSPGEVEGQPQGEDHRHLHAQRGRGPGRGPQNHRLQEEEQKIMRRTLTLAVAVLSLGLVSLSQAEVTQKGNLRLNFDGQITPNKLPRSGSAPVKVDVSVKIAPVSASKPPPQLTSLNIQINRYGVLDGTGLPICEVDDIQPSTTEKGLEACRQSLVGQGSFSANVVASDEAPFPSDGKVYAFYGTYKGKPAILAHVYGTEPVPTSFILPFTISRGKGTYGTTLSAPVPRVGAGSAYVTGISLTLFRRYSYHGEQRSFAKRRLPGSEGRRRRILPVRQGQLRLQRPADLQSQSPHTQLQGPRIAMKRLFAILALAAAAAAIAAAPASAAETSTKMGEVTNASYTSVHVTGLVHAEVAFTGWGFQYSTDDESWEGGPGGFFFSALTAPVQGDITGLKPSTKYFVRLTAGGAISPGPDPEFTTLPVAARRRSSRSTMPPKSNTRPPR